MQLKKKLMYSAITSCAALIGSILLPIVPCKISPLIPNPISRWKLCSLNPDIVNPTSSLKEFFGYTTSFTESYFSVMVISFLISFLILHFIDRKKS